MTKNIEFKDIKELKKFARKFGENLFETESNINLIISPTIDNICAAGILTKLFYEKKIGCHISFLTNTKNQINISKSSYSSYCIIGKKDYSSIISLIKNKSDSKFFLIEKSFKKGEENIFSNLKDFFSLSLDNVDIDTYDSTNAALAYFVAEFIDDKYTRFSDLVILSALGEKQIDTSSQKLRGLSRLILEEGIKSQNIKVEKGTKLVGRKSEPIHLALKYSINPFLPGLTGNEKACTSFLSKQGIKMRDADGEWRTLSDLSIDEVRKLNDGLISLLMSNNERSVQETYKLIGPVYIFTTEPKEKLTRNAEEYLRLIEGACLKKKYSLAMALVLGDRKRQYDHVVRFLSDYFGEATYILDQLEQHPEKPKEFKYYRFMDSTDLFLNDPSMEIFKALIYGQVIPLDKPIIMHIKENKKSELYVYETQTMKKSGISISPLFSTLLGDLIERFDKQGDFYYVLLADEFIEDVLQGINAHFDGTLELDEKKTSKTETKKDNENEKKQAEESNEKKGQEGPMSKIGSKSKKSFKVEKKEQVKAIDENKKSHPKSKSENLTSFLSDEHE